MMHMSTSGRADVTPTRRAAKPDDGAGPSVPAAGYESSPLPSDDDKDEDDEEVPVHHAGLPPPGVSWAEHIHMGLTGVERTRIKEWLEEALWSGKNRSVYFNEFLKQQGIDVKLGEAYRQYLVRKYGGEFKFKQGRPPGTGKPGPTDKGKGKAVEKDKEDEDDDDDNDGGAAPAPPALKASAKWYSDELLAKAVRWHERHVGTRNNQATKFTPAGFKDKFGKHCKNDYQCGQLLAAARAVLKDDHKGVDFSFKRGRKSKDDGKDKE